MKIEDIEWSYFKSTADANVDHLYLYYCELGRITVFDRLAGYDYDIRDIETGFKDNDGKFWLSSGNFDIREFSNLTIEEAIEFIKKCSNICMGE